MSVLGVDTVKFGLTDFEIQAVNSFNRPTVCDFMENPWNYINEDNSYRAKAVYSRDEQNLIHLFLFCNCYMYRPVLYVQVYSLPKLIFGNNVEELDETHFETLVSFIREALLACGVECSEEAIKESEVREIHYSRNFHLAENITCKGVMDIIAKSNVRCSHVRRIEDGVKFESKCIEISWYDKNKEIQERHTNNVDTVQGNLLRYEVKLRKPRRIKRNFINQIFRVPENRKFKNAVNGAFSSYILLSFLRQLKTNMPQCIPIELPLTNPESSIQKIKQDNEEYRVQRRQMQDTLLELYSASRNYKCKDKIYKTLIFNYFLDDEKSINFLKERNLYEKAFRNIFLITPRYENILDTLIAKIEARDENANEE